jgi:hypothetical protein
MTRKHLSQIVLGLGFSFNLYVCFFVIMGSGIREVNKCASLIPSIFVIFSVFKILVSPVIFLILWIYLYYLAWRIENNNTSEE